MIGEREPAVTHYDALIGSELIDNAEQEPIGKGMLGMTTGRSCAAVLIGVVLLMCLHQCTSGGYRGRRSVRSRVFRRRQRSGGRQAHKRCG